MTDLKFHVDAGKCVRCGACIRDCAPRILEFGVDGFPRLVAGGEERCTRCQHCLAICPEGALSILGRAPEASAPNRNVPPPEELLDLIRCRRSFRSYRKENLDPERLKKLREMLVFVPTGVNAHSLDFAFVDELAVMDEIRETVLGRLRKLMALDPLPPEAAGFSRYRRLILAGEDAIFRGAPHLLAVSAAEHSPCPQIDPVIALSYFELYAQSLGVGTLWCGLAAGALRVFPDVMARFAIPEGYRLGYVMLFGPTALHYPRAVQPEPVAIRSVR